MKAGWGIHKTPTKVKPLKENAARAWLKRVAQDRVFWVEAGAGSTFGMPDAFVIGRSGKVLWLELKCGKVSAQGVLTFKLRPEQKRVLKRLDELGANVGVLVAVGEAATDRAVIGKGACTITLRLVNEVYTGRVDLVACQENWWWMVFRGPGSPVAFNSLCGCFDATPV